MRSSIVVTILSRNRGNYLADTIQSWLRQTTKAAKIVVLDNASDPSTVEVVERFKVHGVIMDRCTVPISVAENFKRARQHSSEPWLIVAHDDDIYHPEYLEMVERTLNRADAPSVLLGTMSVDYNPKLEFGYSMRNVSPRWMDARMLAQVLYDGMAVNFGATVYRREIFAVLEPDWVNYANLFDRPFLLECARDGGAMLIEGPVVKYRVHAGQDVRNAAATLPSLYACNLVRCYRRWLRPRVIRTADSFARRSLYLLWVAVQRGERGKAFRAVRDTGILSPEEWLWGALCFPWYFARYRIAIWVRHMQEKFSK